MIYFDSTYLVRLYYMDRGYEAVRQLSATAAIACAVHGRAEVVSAFHRKLREGHITAALYRIALKEFTDESRAGVYRWLPLSPAVMDRLERVYSALPANCFLRAADALHLACAAENHFREIYTNDQRLLVAAAHFGLKGVNVI